MKSSTSSSRARDVLARELHVARPDRDAVAAEDAELLEVDVDRVLPAARVVLEDPPLRRWPEREAEAVQSMNWPFTCHAAVAALEPERPREAAARWLMSGSEIGANTASVAVAGTWGTTPARVEAAVRPARADERNSSSWSPWPAGRILPSGRGR
jgi:hypothetical protein